MLFSSLTWVLAITTAPISETRRITPASSIPSGWLRNRSRPMRSVFVRLSALPAAVSGRSPRTWLMMVSAASILLLLSVWCFYIVAGKIEFESKGLVLKLTERPLLSRGLGVLFGIIGTGLLIIKLGKVNGILSALCIWTAIACLVLLFAPFQKVKALHLIFAMLSLVAIEFVTSL